MVKEVPIFWLSLNSKSGRLGHKVQVHVGSSELSVAIDCWSQLIIGHSLLSVAVDCWSLSGVSCSQLSANILAKLEQQKLMPPAQGKSTCQPQLA